MRRARRARRSWCRWTLLLGATSLAAAPAHGAAAPDAAAVAPALAGDTAPSASTGPLSSRGGGGRASSSSGGNSSRRLSGVSLSGPRVHLVTFMDQAQPEFAYLQVTAEAHGLYPMILGYGMKTWWPDGLGMKINALRAYVHGPLLADDVVLFVDAFDVAIFGDEAEILEHFTDLERETNRSLIFNCERVCYPNFPGVCDAYPPSGGARFHYLNSGLMAGRVHAFRRMLAEPVPDIIPGGDQAWYQRYYLAHQNEIALDKKCLLVCAIMGTDEESGARWEGRLVQVYTGNKPAAVHFVSRAHWAMWKDGRSTSIIHEAFRKLHPTVADRMLESIRLVFSVGGIHSLKMSWAADSTVTLVYKGLVASVYCLRCRVFRDETRECQSVGPCGSLLTKLLFLPTVLSVAMAWRCCCRRRTGAGKVSVEEGLEEGKESLRDAGTVAGLCSFFFGRCPGCRRHLLPQKMRYLD